MRQSGVRRWVATSAIVVMPRLRFLKPGTRNAKSARSRETPGASSFIRRGSAAFGECDALRLGELLEGFPAFRDAVGVPEELVLLDAAIAANRDHRGRC